jgi:hypothetical protein
MNRFFGHIFEQTPLLSLKPVDLLKDTSENLLLFEKKIPHPRKGHLIVSLTSILIVTFFLISAQEVWSFFAPYPPSSKRPAVIIGEETKRFLSDLEQEGMEYQVVARITRKLEFSVEGVTVTLDGDNIQIFEYPDYTIASKEAEAFASQYKTPRWQNSWKTPIRIYQKDTLLVYYMGTHETVANKLYETLKLPNLETIQR